MKKYTRYLGFVLAIILFQSVFAGCGNNTSANLKEVPAASETKNDTTGQTTVEKTTEEPPLEIKWFNQFEQSKPYDQEKDELKKAIEKQLNVKFIADFASFADYAQKLDLKIASGDIPDIIWRLNYETGFKKYASQGIFYDLTNEISETKTPNLYSAVGQQYWDLVKYNSKILAIPYQQGPGAGFRWNLIMRQDYLNTIGEKQPATIDQYYSVLKKVKESLPDVIPLGAYQQSIGKEAFANNSFDHIFCAFNVTPGYFFQNNGKFGCYDIDPRMKDALLFLKQMYAEKLIDQEFVTLKGTNLNDKLYAGKIFSATGWWTMAAIWDKGIEESELRKANKLGKDEAIKEDLTNEPFKYMLLSDYLSDNNGKGIAPVGAPFSLVFAINAKAKDPQRLLQVIEKAHAPENQLLLWYGEEGKEYKIDNGNLKNIRNETINSETNVDKDGNFRGFEMYSIVTGLNGAPRYLETLPLRNAMAINISLNCKYGVLNASNYLDSPKLLEKATELRTMRDSAFDQIIMGGDVDKIFDEFVMKWKAEGGDQIIKELEESYKMKSGK